MPAMTAFRNLLQACVAQPACPGVRHQIDANALAPESGSGVVFLEKPDLDAVFALCGCKCGQRQRRPSDPWRVNIIGDPLFSRWRSFFCGNSSPATHARNG